MSERPFSKKAKRHAAQSRKRTKQMLKSAARRSGPVKTYYLSGFAPVEPETSELTTRFPFVATINGEHFDVEKVDGKVVFTRWDWLHEADQLGSPVA